MTGGAESLSAAAGFSSSPVTRKVSIYSLADPKTGELTGLALNGRKF
jgi:hypothetical protein